MLNGKIADPETRKEIEKNCGEIKEKCIKQPFKW